MSGRLGMALPALYDQVCIDPPPILAIAGKWAETFKEFPPIRKPNTFTLDDALAAMSRVGAGG